MAGRDEADHAIQQALKEEEARKELKRQSKLQDEHAHKAARKGMTLEQLEAQEGGPIKESMVGMAQTKRASRRKGKGVGDTDLVDDVEDIEEELEEEEEGGVKLEAFNLKEERQRGYFDEGGNYVEHGEKEGEEEKDAWLDSEEAKVVDEKTLRRIQEQQRRMAEADAALAPTATQLARLQWQVAQLLELGETVAGGLKRLGGHSRRPAKRVKRASAAPEPPAPAPDPAAKERFDRLTEASSALMDAGETDVYSRDRGYFERAAAMYIDVDNDTQAGTSTFLAAPGKAAYEEADEDMFGDEEDAGGAKAELATDLDPAPAAAAVQAGPAGAQPREAAEDATDYASWPIKELRRFLTERGQDAAGIVEKGDLVAKVKAVADTGGRGSAANAPAGYAFDPASKLWYSAEAGMYWDPASGAFFNTGDNIWYSYGADGKWAKWKDAGQ